MFERVKGFAKIIRGSIMKILVFAPIIAISFWARTANTKSRIQVNNANPIVQIIDSVKVTYASKEIADFYHPDTIKRRQADSMERFFERYSNATVPPFKFDYNGTFDNSGSYMLGTDGLFFEWPDSSIKKIEGNFIHENIPFLNDLKKECNCKLFVDGTLFHAVSLNYNIKIWGNQLPPSFQKDTLLKRVKEHLYRFPFYWKVTGSIKYYKGDTANLLPYLVVPFKTNMQPRLQGEGMR